MISYHVPATRDSDYYALDVLNQVLSNGHSSRLYSALVDQQQLATDIQTGMAYSFDPFTFNIYAQCSDSTKATDLEKAIYVQLDKIKNEIISLISNF